MSHAYLDCFSGISGDMFVGAMLDLGCDLEYLRHGLHTLPIEGWSVEARREKRGGFAGTRFLVQSGEEKSHRHLADLEKIVMGGDLPEGVQARSLAVFRRIAEAEGKAHGMDAGKVHFHEVGAVDTIIDVVAGALALENLGIQSLSASTVAVGGGFVNCDHGKVPVPAPGTMALLEGLPIRIGQAAEGELTTPTGAAILACWTTPGGSPGTFRASKTGYGVGTRSETPVPNLLRVLLGEAEEASGSDRIYLLEANLDDIPGEVIGHALEEIYRAGAVEAFLTPVQMKKNRPGVVLSALVDPARRRAVEEVFFRETTTLGVRRTLVERTKLGRTTREVATPLGSVRCKIVIDANGKETAAPEFDSLQAIAREKNLPLREVAARVERALFDASS